jgi:Fe-S oxidoreductase
MSGNTYSFYLEDKALNVTQRPRKFLEAFATILEHSNYYPMLEAYSRLCARCGRCAENCQLYQVTGEDRDIPAARAELLLTIFRRYFTATGTLKARLMGGGFTLTDAHLDQMAEAAYRCVCCRRCNAACPMGIDNGLLTHLSRWLLAEVGIIPKGLVTAVREQLEGTGNTSAITVPGLRDTCAFLEEELHDIYGVDIKFPFDVEGAEYVFFPAVSDYLLEPDVLMGHAAVMHLCGGSWTIGTGNFDGINYGLFYSDRMLEKIVKNEVAEVRRLKGRKILIGECGHATRSAKFGPTFCGPDSPPVVNFLQFTAAQLRAGRIPLKKELISEITTYHDPCNFARTGWLTEEPREILKAICSNFVEMTPNRKENYCCGGGSGLVSIDEIRGFRTGTLGKRKAEQIRATGAKYLVAPCANCKKQLREVCADNDLKDVEVVGLHQLLLKTIDFSALKAAQANPGGKT